MPNGVATERLTETVVATGAGAVTGLLIGATERQQVQTANLLTLGGLMIGLGFGFIGPQGLLADTMDGVAAASAGLLGRKLGRGEPILGGSTSAHRPRVGSTQTIPANGQSPRAAVSLLPDEQERTLVTRI